MLTIRKARQSDLKAVSTLWKEFARYFDGLAVGNKTLAPHMKRKRGAPESFMRWARRHIGSKRGALFLAEVDGRPVGYSFIYIKRNPGITKIDTFGYVEDLFVRERFRGQGISSQLMNESMKWFLHRKIRHISLHVLDENHIPRTIYEKWGFFPFITEMRKDL